MLSFSVAFLVPSESIVRGSTAKRLKTLKNNNKEKDTGTSFRYGKFSPRNVFVDAHVAIFFS